MRRLKAKPAEAERGSVGALVAVMMLVLIGAGALAVDVGQIYSERAQLQNGADAGALGVAQACHKTGCTQAEAEAFADTLASGNANDGDANVSEVDLSVPDEVTVRTTTKNGSSSVLAKLFASALNAPAVSVGAHATASIEVPGSGGGFPLALSECQYDLTDTVETGVLQQIRYKPGMTDCTSTSGHAIPGGFGWLDQNGGPCRATTDVEDNAAYDPGADYPNNPGENCDSVLQGWINTIQAGDEVLGVFPVFDNAGKDKGKGWFHVRGYATFQMVGWKFGGGSTSPRTYNNSPATATACVDPCRGIIGKFKKYESIDAFDGNSGTGDDLGTVFIRLTN
jgi:Flp pilus assembly protein TadG